MLKAGLPRQQENILEILARYRHGTNIKQIADSLTDPPHKRTVQRWLATLAAKEYINIIGKGRATIYKLSPVADKYRKISTTTNNEIQEDYASYIPISQEGQEIISYVQQNKVARTPVGYEQGFLRDYIPNETQYLSESLRTHLYHIGNTEEQEDSADSYGRTILSRLIIDLSWASSRLEGNTYSRLDTKRLIEWGQYAQGKDAQEAQMILNHKAAIELLVNESDDIRFDSHTFLSLHGLLSENLMPDPKSSGRLRHRPVHIGGSIYVPLAMPQLIEEYFQTILRKAAAIDNPFEQAFFIMVHLPYLQPFEDVNKRVSRLGANISLIKHNLCPLTFLDVPHRAYIDALLGVYEMNRYELLCDLFVWAYERSVNEYIAVRKSQAEPDQLRLRYRKELHELINDIVCNQSQDIDRDIVSYADRQIDLKKRPSFVEMVKKELKLLHMGIIARYHIRPSEFTAWRKTQEEKN